MSHDNAALTPRHRLRIARLIVDEILSVYEKTTVP